MDQPVQEQAQVADEVEGGRLGVVGDVQHGIPHRPALLRRPGLVDGPEGAQARRAQILLRPQAPELQPNVFPGVVLVGEVGVHQAGADEEPLVGAQLIAPGGAVGAGGVQLAMARDDVVEQEIVAHKRPEGVQGGALLPAVLEQPQVQKVFIGENGKRELFHIRTHPFLPQKLYQQPLKGSDGSIIAQVFAKTNRE